MMEKHPVEDGLLLMPRMIDSRHGGRMASRNGPKPRKRPCLPGKRHAPRRGYGRNFSEQVFVIAEDNSGKLFFPSVYVFSLKPEG